MGRRQCRRFGCHSSNRSPAREADHPVYAHFRGQVDSLAIDAVLTLGLFALWMYGVAVATEGADHDVVLLEKRCVGTAFRLIGEQSLPVTVGIADIVPRS